MKGFKGFNKGLICKEKQYRENEIFTEEKAEPCKSGMHFCENPFNVLSYYEYVNINGNVPELNEFAEVEALEEVLTDDNEKYTTTKLKIVAKLSIHSFVNAFVEFTLSKIKKEDTATNTGDMSAATNTGYRSAATNTGYRSAATVKGKESIAVAWGYKSVARGVMGCYLVLAERDDKGVLLNAKMVKVDGEKVKENTYYKLVNNELEEVQNE